MGKIKAKSIFRLVPLIGDLGRFLQAFTLKILVFKQCCNLGFANSDKMYPYMIGRKIVLIEMSSSFTLVLI